MHDCRKFRERVIEREFAPASDAFREFELDSCADCERFLQEAIAVSNAVRGIGQTGITALPPEESWNRFETRLRTQLATEPTPRRRPLSRWLDWMEFPLAWRLSRHPRWLALGAAAVAVLAMTVWRPATPPETSLPTETANAAPLPLDPQTVEFLGHSEMFLRDFSKLQATDAADLEDARERARMQLAAIAQRKAAVVAVPPVWTALEEYETVLREIKNLDESSGGDVEDIQSRIARQGLIAAMKVYQPQTARADLRHDRREN